jgi:hypothetical protein
MMSTRILLAPHMMRFLFAVLTIIVLPHTHIFAQVTQEVRVILTDGPGRDVVSMLERNAGAVMTAINRYDPRKGKVELPATIGSGDGAYGVERLTDLVKTSGIRTNAGELRSQVIMLNQNTYEIRRMYVTSNANAGNRSLELILNFDADGRLTDARFAIEEHQFNMIIQNAISLEDDFRRRFIINFIEQFKTAYNRKDADYIELQFSDKALIITGTRITEFGGSGNMVRTRDNEMVRERFRLNRQTKAEYIDRLKNVIFKNNAFVNVDFSGINILKHPDYEEIYWVQVFQKWSSTTYSDEGYLSFMIDFSNEDQPLIYVRAWQPEPFEDGTLIDLNMFEIIK